MAPVAHVQRAGRIGRDEFEDHFLAGAGGGAAKLLALGQHGMHHGLLARCRHAQIDEAGSGDIGALDDALGGAVGQHRGHNALGQFAWIHLELLGQLHSDIAGHVAVGWIARALEHHIGHDGGAGNDGCEGGLEQGDDVLFLRSEHVRVRWVK